MGNAIVYFSPNLYKKDEPDAFAPYKYEPEFGYGDQPRQERAIPVSKAEMDSANLDDRARNFCAHAEIQYRSCMKSNVPLWYKCKGLQNELHDCYYDERIHDMKEFERERRLNVRERRIREAANS